MRSSPSARRSGAGSNRSGAAGLLPLSACGRGERTVEDGEPGEGFSIAAPLSRLASLGTLSPLRGARGKNALPRQRRDDTRPGARALVERGEIVFLVRRMHAVVVETESDQQ